MKRLLTFFLSTCLITPTTLAIYACSKTNTSEVDDDNSESGKDFLDQEIKAKIIEEIQAPIDSEKDGYGYLTATFKEFGYSSGSSFDQEIGNSDLTENETLKEKLNEYITNNKLREIGHRLKKEYDVFNTQQEPLQIKSIDKVQKELLNLTEIKKLLFDFNQEENQTSVNGLLEGLGEIIKFKVSITLTYSIDGDNKTINQDLTFYLVSDKNKFDNIQELLTEFAKKKLKEQLNNHYLKLDSNITSSKSIISNYSINKISENLLNTILSPDKNNIVENFKINAGLIWNVNNNRFLENYKRITNIDDIDIYQIYDSLQPNAGLSTQMLFENKYNTIAQSISNKENKDDISFEYDIVSSTLYGYNLKKIYYQEMKILLDYKKILKSIKEDYEMLPTIIRLLFNNNYSQLVKTQSINDKQREFNAFYWNIKPTDNKPYIWDPNECVDKCQNDDKYIINSIINKNVLDDWFMKSVLPKYNLQLSNNLNIALDEKKSGKDSLVHNKYGFNEKYKQITGTNYTDTIGFYTAKRDNYYDEDLNPKWKTLNHYSINIKFNMLNVLIPLNMLNYDFYGPGTNFHIKQIIEQQ